MHMNTGCLSQEAWDAGRNWRGGAIGVPAQGTLHSSQPQVTGETPSPLSHLLQQMLSPRILIAQATWRVRRPGITSSSVSGHWTLPAANTRPSDGCWAGPWHTNAWIPLPRSLGELG